MDIRVASNTKTFVILVYNIEDDMKQHKQEYRKLFWLNQSLKVYL